MEVLASNSPARLAMYRLGRRIQDVYESAASAMGRRIANWSPRTLMENARVASHINLLETDKFLSSMGPAISQSVNRSLVGMGRRSFSNLNAANNFLIRTAERAKAFGGEMSHELRTSLSEMGGELQRMMDPAREAVSSMKTVGAEMREDLGQALQDMASAYHETYVGPARELMSTINEAVRGSRAIPNTSTGQVTGPDKLLSQQLIKLSEEAVVQPTPTEARRTATLGTSHSPNGGEVINSWRENFHQMVSRSQDNL